MLIKRIELDLPDTKMYYTIIEIKPVQYWKKNRPMERLESLGKNQCMQKFST